MRDVTHATLALLLIALFAASYALPFFVPIPDGEAGTLIVGTAKVIENAVILVLGYYFGSSRGSAAKDQTIADLAAAPPAGLPVAPSADDFTIPPPPGGS